MAINLTSVFNAYLKRFLTGHKNVTNVHLSDRQLSLRSFTLPRKIERKPVLTASSVTKSSAWVLIRSLRPESHTTCHLGIRPDLSLKRFNLEDLILEKHRIFCYSFADGLVLTGESRKSFRSAAVTLRLQLVLVVGVVWVETPVIVVVRESPLREFTFDLCMLVRLLNRELGV